MQFRTHVKRLLMVLNIQKYTVNNKKTKKQQKNKEKNV
jgi:hypothetical protein